MCLHASVMRLDLVEHGTEGCGWAYKGTQTGERMKRLSLWGGVAVALCGVAAAAFCPMRAVKGASAAEDGVLTYTKDGGYVVPQNYREWVFLSSGIDMVYGPKAATSMGHSMFDNVFVDPQAYHYFLAHGTWPDKTVMILEIRGADSHASINHGGHSQAGEVMGMEVHVKDASRFGDSPDNWAFFDVNGDLGKLIPRPATCYTCHSEHAAVDTTFVQFYPTLLPIATTKGTLSTAYVKEFGAGK